jgi:hypothetical protein
MAKTPRQTTAVLPDVAPSCKSSVSDAFPLAMVQSIVAKDKRVAWVVRLCILLCLVATAFTLFGLGLRIVNPLAEYAESCVVHAADRLGSGLPLYVDPKVGTNAVYPTRYYVPYSPVTVAWTVLFPAVHRLVLARFANSLAFVVVSSLLLWDAKKQSAKVFWPVLLFPLTSYCFCQWAGNGKPDWIACLAVVLGFRRVLRKGEADPWVVTLFLFGFWMKPSFFGLAAGTLSMDVLFRREAALQVVLAAFVLGLGSFGALYWFSGGALRTHMQAAMAFYFQFDTFVENMVHYTQFFGGTLVATLCFRRWDRFLAGVFASLFLSLVAFGKLGASHNYWIEPIFAALTWLTCPRHPSEAGRKETTCGAAEPWRYRPRVWVGVTACMLSLVCSSTATFPSVKNLYALKDEGARAIAFAKQTCDLGPNEVAIAGEPGVEYVLNGRILSHQLEFVWQQGKATFPTELFLEDAKRKELRCVVYLEPSDPSEPGRGFLQSALAKHLNERFRTRSHQGLATVFTP